MITIHYDFTDGTELSYIEGLRKGDNFTTCCLDFFSSDNKASDIMVLDRKGNTLFRNRLMRGEGHYTTKEIRISHNIRKMLIAGSFNWQRVTQ